MKTCKDCDFCEMDNVNIHYGECHYNSARREIPEDYWCSKLTIDGIRQTKIKQEKKDINMEEILTKIIDFVRNILDD